MRATRWTVPKSGLRSSPHISPLRGSELCGPRVDHRYWFEAWSGDLDVFPEAEASADRFHSRLRRLVGPGVAFMAGTVDQHVIELDAMRAGAVGLGLRRLFEPRHAHR